MIASLAAGTLVIALSVMIQAEMFNRLSRNFEAVILFCRKVFRRFANTAAIIAGVLFIMLTQMMIVWLWALTMLAVGAMEALEPAFYFALVSFTTVGFGDIVLAPPWRVLSGLAAVNGFLSFGWSAAYMVELVRRTA
jgi:hypothetical protein